MKEALVYDKYDVVAEANQIANAAFGDAYNKDLAMLDEVRTHAVGCGCPMCIKYYDQVLELTMTKYVSPFER